MTDEQEKPSQSFNIQGGVKGNNVNIGGNQTFSGNISIGGRSSGADDGVIKQLNEQINALKAELDKLRADHPDKVADVEMALQDTVAEIEKDKPDKQRIQRRGELLKQAAQDLAAVAPIAVQIAKTLTMIG